MPLDGTYCQRVLAGRLPNLIPDVRGDERAASLPITEAAGVGAFASVPLTFSDGRLYGPLCAASHDTKPGLGYRELLVAAVEARDAYTGDHSRAVVEHAVTVARRLGLSEAEAADIEHVALLHDIGKIAVPDAILNKPGSLTIEEWDVMRGHPLASEELIGNVPGLGHLAPSLRAEHERWDGGGYPDGLAGEAIPMASRITFVCDAYHAMTSDRPYRDALPLAEARRELRDNAGSQFDPRVVAALLDAVE